MLKNFSWSDYFIAIAILLLIYYLFVIVRYYKDDLKSLLKQPTKITATENDEAINNDFETLQNIVSDLKREVFDQAEGHWDKTQLLSQISDQLSGYKDMDRLAFRVAINHFIIQHAKEICGVVFSEQELEEEWEKLPR